MDEETKIGRRDAAILVIGPVAALFIPLALSALPLDTQEKVKADKVAKKVEKARLAGEKQNAHAAKEEREALKHFKKELDEYADLHVKEYAKLGAQESAAAQAALALAIAAKRARAKQGDIFLPEIQPLLRRLASEQLKGPDAQEARKAVVEGNPGVGAGPASVLVPMKVNAVYPVGAARSTVPASLLLSLPPLPECLHYRFVNRDLILVDSVAQIIVDFLPTVAPVLPKS